MGYKFNLKYDASAMNYPLYFHQDAKKYEDFIEPAFQDAVSTWNTLIEGLISGIAKKDVTHKITFEIVYNLQYNDKSKTLAATHAEANGELFPTQSTIKLNYHYAIALGALNDKDKAKAELKKVYLHEILHGIGFTAPKDGFDSGMFAKYFQSHGITYSYTGPLAVGVFHDWAPYYPLSNTLVPLEGLGKIDGTTGSHWNDYLFADKNYDEGEIMVGAICKDMKISKLTLMALRDLGYNANWKKAQPFSPPCAHGTFVVPTDVDTPQEPPPNVIRCAGPQNVTAHPHPDDKDGKEVTQVMHAMVLPGSWEADDVKGGKQGSNSVQGTTSNSKSVQESDKSTAPKAKKNETDSSSNTKSKRKQKTNTKATKKQK